MWLWYKNGSHFSAKFGIKIGPLFQVSALRPYPNYTKVTPSPPPAQVQLFPGVSMSGQKDAENLVWAAAVLLNIGTVWSLN